MSETIVAIATPPGRGGVGIVRLSGFDAYAIGLALSQKKELKPNSATYTSFYIESSECIDNGFIIYFKAPKTFTGEDVVELQVHGSPVVLDCLVNQCIALKARLARPGEFSERAFLNDKIDLAQAEAIVDLIHASSLTAARMALRSLQGDFSKKVHALSERITEVRLFVEAAIDFPEEEIDFLKDSTVIEQVHVILEAIRALMANAEQGALVREGLSIVIAGQPNAGKSTLMNALAGREVAIVTEIAGTTRDVMREYVLMDELPVHFIDTAGLRKTEDLVEQEGIKRAWDEVRKADCVLLVSDIGQEICAQLSQELETQIPESVPLIPVFNKIDTVQATWEQREEAVYISAKEGIGLDSLKARIKKAIGYQPTEGQFLARRRHLDALKRACQFLDQGLEQVSHHRAFELLAEDLRNAHQALCEITGECTADDLLGKIFSTFCIGK